MPTLRWAGAFAALWIGLTVVQELGAPEIAAGLAVTVAMSLLIAEGNGALGALDRILS